MKTRAYTESHIHAISSTEADCSVLGRESALRRILHILQGEAIDFGDGRGTAYVEGRQALADRARCKVRNVRVALARLRQSGWIVEATVLSSTGSIHSGFLVALSADSGFGGDFFEEKTRDLRVKYVPLERQGSGNVRQGSGNVERDITHPERRKPDAQTSTGINNACMQFAQGDLFPRAPRVPTSAVDAKVPFKPLDALDSEHREHVLELADEVFEHELRRYREHWRFKPGALGPVKVRADIAAALLLLNELESPKTYEEHLNIARAIVEFKFARAEGQGTKAKDEWEYWDRLWSLDSVTRVHGWLQEDRNMPCLYRGMGGTKREAGEAAGEAIAFKLGVRVDSTPVLNALMEFGLA